MFYIVALIIYIIILCIIYNTKDKEIEYLKGLIDSREFEICKEAIRNTERLLEVQSDLLIRITELNRFELIDRINIEDKLLVLKVIRLDFSISDEDIVEFKLNRNYNVKDSLVNLEKILSRHTYYDKENHNKYVKSLLTLLFS